MTPPRLSRWEGRKVAVRPLGGHLARPARWRLKNTDTDILFQVVAEPYIDAWEASDSKAVVENYGLDVYDLNTGVAWRSSHEGRIVATPCSGLGRPAEVEAST